MPDHLVDWTAYTIEEIERERDRLFAELEQRYQLMTAGERVNDLNRAMLAAKGVCEGDPWQQPATPAEGYPQGWVLPDSSGAEWASDVPANMSPPGSNGWSRKPQRSADEPGRRRAAGAGSGPAAGDRVPGGKGQGPGSAGSDAVGTG